MSRDENKRGWWRWFFDGLVSFVGFLAGFLFDILAFLLELIFMV